MVFDWTQSVAKSNFKLRLPLLSPDYSEISIGLEISSRLCMNRSVNALADASTMCCWHAAAFGFKHLL